MLVGRVDSVTVVVIVECINDAVAIGIGRIVEVTDFVKVAQSVAVAVGRRPVKPQVNFVGVGDAVTVGVEAPQIDTSVGETRVYSMSGWL